MDDNEQRWSPAAGGADASVRGRSGTRGRVLVVGEHGLVAAGMQLALTERRWQAATSCGPALDDVVDRAQAVRPDVVLVDVCHGVGSGGIGNGTDLIRRLRSTGTKVVMLTSERRRTGLAEYLEAGADGWIRKTAALDEVDLTLGRVVAGQSIIGRAERAALLDRLRNERLQARRAGACLDHLTEREALVLAALIDGLSADEIARENVVALNTVRSQIRAVLNKLGVRSQLAAVAAASTHRALLPQRGNEVRDRRRVAHPDAADASESSVHIA